MLTKNKEKIYEEKQYVKKGVMHGCFRNNDSVTSVGLQSWKCRFTSGIRRRKDYASRG